MEAPESESRTFLTTFAVLLVLYLVGIGPVARVFDFCPPRIQQAIVVFYTPLLWLDAIVPGKPVSKYADLWKPY